MRYRFHSFRLRRRYLTRKADLEILSLRFRLFVWTCTVLIADKCKGLQQTRHGLSFASDPPEGSFPTFETESLPFTLEFYSVIESRYRRFVSPFPYESRPDPARGRRDTCISRLPLAAVPVRSSFMCLSVWYLEPGYDQPRGCWFRLDLRDVLELDAWIHTREESQSKPWLVAMSLSLT